jgi:hypothetical protein
MEVPLMAPRQVFPSILRVVACLMCSFQLSTTALAQSNQTQFDQTQFNRHAPSGDAAGTQAYQEQSHPLDPAITMARASLEHIRANVRDYTALFVKRARVDAQLSELEYAQIKIRNRKVENGRITVPLSVYMGFQKPDSIKGREVLWVEGRNNGKIIAHEAGFRNLANVKLDPTGYLAMRGQRYPISEMGIENLVIKLIETAERDRRYGECDVQFYANAKVGDEICNMIEVIHPVERPYFEFHRAQVFFSQRLNVPIRYASWSWPTEPGGEPVLEEEYTYLNIKLNVGLDDQDFNTANPSYRFW